MDSQFCSETTRNLAFRTTEARRPAEIFEICCYGFPIHLAARAAKLQVAATGQTRRGR